MALHLNITSIYYAHFCLTLAACLSDSYSNLNRHQLRQYFQSTYPQSDIDLFLYGLDEQAALAKLQNIVETVQGNAPHDSYVVRTAHAITIVTGYPYRHVQIILRLYKSPAEILMGFDLDWYGHFCFN